MIWEIVSIVSLVIGIILFLISIFKVLKLYQLYGNKKASANYQKDNMLLTKYIAGNHNNVFLNQQDSKEWIDQYLITDEDGIPCLICHFKKEITDQRILEIKSYNKGLRLIKVEYFRLHEHILKDAPIQLPRHTESVNLNIIETDDYLEVYKDTYRDKKKAYNRINLLTSISLGFFMIPAGIYVLKKEAGERFESFMIVDTVILGLVLIVGLALLNYLLYFGWFYLRDRKAVYR